MKQRAFAVMLLLLWLTPVTGAWAESQLVLNHRLTGYTMGTNAVTLTYALQIKNTGASSISSLTLSYVPIEVLPAEAVRLSVPVLGASEEVIIPFTLSTAILLDEELAPQLRFVWQCDGTDEAGRPVSEAVKSRQGGAL